MLPAIRLPLILNRPNADCLSERVATAARMNLTSSDSPPVTLASRKRSKSWVIDERSWSFIDACVVLSRAKPATPRTTAKTSMNSSADRNATPEKTLARRMDGIAGIARGVDQRHVERLVHLRTQPAHMGFHHGGLGVEVEIPDLLEQHCLGDDAAGVAHEHLEQSEFLGLQVNVDAGPLGRMAQEIE